MNTQPNPTQPPAQLPTPAHQPGDVVFLETQELPVKILDVQPCKASVLSQWNDAWEYQVETQYADNGNVFWVFQDAILVTYGDDDDPFIF